MIMARKKIIAGNWKMNMTPSQAVELINTLKPLVANDEVDVSSVRSRNRHHSRYGGSKGFQYHDRCGEYVFRGEGCFHRRDFSRNAG